MPDTFLLTRECKQIMRLPEVSDSTWKRSLHHGWKEDKQIVRAVGL